VRARYWKNEAASPSTGTSWTTVQLKRMRRGAAPQRFNASKGGLESMDLSHEPVPARLGGRQVVARWPQDHAGVDSWRRPGY
jgi:filamentous hemagglutinin